MSENAMREQVDPEVQLWMERLAREVARTETTYVQIADRLSSVSRDALPSGDKEVTPEVQLVPLANEIRDAVQKLNQVSLAYENMQSRLEL